MISNSYLCFQIPVVIRCIQLSNLIFRKGEIIITDLVGRRIRTFRYTGNKVIWA